MPKKTDAGDVNRFYLPFYSAAENRFNLEIKQTKEGKNGCRRMPPDAADNASF